MKRFLLAVGLLVSTISSGQSGDYSYQAVPFNQIKLTDNFWLPRIKTNHTVTIPASFERCENTGRIKNFIMAANKQGKFCTTFPFDDTDIYKTIEGASFSLRWFPDKKMEAYIDSLIIIISNAQEPDGYLFTARTINPNDPHPWAGNERWVKERELSHELYNAGHLYEAAVAHYQVTGKKNLLNIALKNADLVCKEFGPDKRHVAPGHEIVEMGLVKLYRITGKKEYLETAKFFIEERGQYKGYDVNSKDVWKNGAYWQDHLPVIAQKEVIGHAVRAGYLYSAVADVAALMNDQQLLTAIDSLWNNFVSKKIYVQGGAGAVGSGERYGNNYELPNETAYNETCAAISNVYWAHRMFLLHGHSEYIDVLEKILYNGLLSGLGLDGKSFFYTNAMQITTIHPGQEAKRSGWFECSCCPTNLVRLLPSVPGYAYAQKDNDIYVNLFMSSTASIDLDKKPVTITQENNYPWNGDLKFKIQPFSPTSFSLKIRIPGWTSNEAIPSDLYKFQTNSKSKIEIRINGKPVEYKMENGYAVLTRKWNKNDVVDLQLPMKIERVVANDKVKADVGKVALQRGPLIYCAEWVDNSGKASNILLSETASLNSEYKNNLLNGVTVIKAEVPVISISKNGEQVFTEKKIFTAIPYYAWANRGEGEMMIWFPQKLGDVALISKQN